MLLIALCLDRGMKGAVSPKKKNISSHLKLHDWLSYKIAQEPTASSCGRIRKIVWVICQ